MRIILASASPRRRELLSGLFSEFDIMSADVDETLDAGLSLRDGVRELALRKGEPISREHPEALVISADTLVELDGVALGKPSDEQEAREMLGRLSGRTHFVHTGIAVRYKGRTAADTATSRVSFRTLSEREIAEYVATGEPLDKAGAYGIQGEGGRLVESFEGDFDTIVGLSVSLTERLVGEVTENDKQ